MRRSHLLKGKASRARPPTGQHAPGPPPTDGDQTHAGEAFLWELLPLVAGQSFGLAREMWASTSLLRVFAFFLAPGVRAVSPRSAAFVQKLSQPHLVPKLPGDGLLFVSLRQETLCFGQNAPDETPRFRPAMAISVAL